MNHSNVPPPIPNLPLTGPDLNSRNAQSKLPSGGIVGPPARTHPVPGGRGKGLIKVPKNKIPHLKTAKTGSRADNQPGILSPTPVSPPPLPPASQKPQPQPRQIPTGAELVRRKSGGMGRVSPREIGLGGMLVVSYPSMWKSQGGLAAELAAVLDGVREDLAHKKPSLQKIENLCQNYDLGTELGRFTSRVEEAHLGLNGSVPREDLKSLLDVVSEAAWWLLQSYSREELREVSEPPPIVTLDGLSDEEEEDIEVEVEDTDVKKDDKHVKTNKTSNIPVPIADASKQLYIDSSNVLQTFEGRCMERIEKLANSLVVTEDTANWRTMIGKNCTSVLIRELELGANDPTTRVVGSKIFIAVENAFDQYTGLRQVGDFRGLPEAPFQLTDAVQLISRLYENTLVVGLQTSENLELVDEFTLVNTFEALCLDLVSEYHAFKDGILAKLGFLSSLRETHHGGRSLNSAVVLDYIRAVMDICDKCVEQLTTQFNERIQQIEYLPAAKQVELFASMGGRQELGQSVRAYLFQVKPWARESIQVQTQSLMQREVFGKSRNEILNILSQSKDQMLSGFRSLIEGRIPEPLNRLGEIISQLDTMLEAHFAKKTGFGKRSKNPGKISSRGKRSGLKNETSVAFSGMTIRGTKWKEEELNEFLDDDKKGSRNRKFISRRCDVMKKRNKRIVTNKIATSNNNVRKKEVQYIETEKSKEPPNDETFQKYKEEEEEEDYDAVVSIPKSVAIENYHDQGMCISMHQPWASLLAFGIKRVEGRTWQTKFRGFLWIHSASKKASPDLIQEVESQYRGVFDDSMFPERYPTSCIVGRVFVENQLSKAEYRLSGAEEENDSEFVFICTHFVHLRIPLSASGDHKIWKMEKGLFKSCKNMIDEID